MFDDLKQKGNQFAVKRAILGLIGSAGLFVIFFLNVFGLEADSLQRFRVPVIALCALGAAASIVNLMRSKNAESGIEKFCAKTADPAATMARLEKTWNEGYDFGTGRMDSEYIILALGVSSKVIPLENAVWIYKKTAQQQGLTTHTHLFVCYSNAKYKSVALSPGFVDAITGYIYINSPEIVVGFDDKLDNLYINKDVQGFKEYALVQRTGVRTEI